MVACLDDAATAAFVEGLLSAPEIEHVESHLDTCDSCRQQVSLMVRVRGSAPRSTEPPRATVTEIADGRYQMRRLLGIGSMGVVYAAFDVQLKREIALKLLRSGGNRDRLLAEAQAMAQLRDPHVVTVHDVGTDGDQVYIAMELVAGTTLTEWARVPHALADALAVLVRAGRGLAAAHAAGLVHRDFKPDNVLVGTDGRVCVTDFGLARLVPSERDAAPPHDVALTRSGAVVGTPAYMAPEQLRAEPATAASDQFSFCVTAYEVLCGRRPFRGASVAELLDATTHARWATPRPKLPRRVQRVLDRGLAADPAARHRSMAALLDGLAPRRRPWVAGAAALAAVALAAAGFATRSTAREACPAIAGTWNLPATARLWSGLWASGGRSAPALARSVQHAIDRYAASWQREQDAVCALDPPPPARVACLADRHRELAAWLTAYEQPDRAALDRALESIEAIAPAEACRHVQPVPAGDPIIAARLDGELAALAAAHAAGRYVAAAPRAEAAIALARTAGDRWREARALLVRGQMLLDGGDAPAAEPVLFAAFTAASEVGDDAVAARAGLQQIYAYSWRLARPDDARRWVELTRASVVRLGDEALAATLDSTEAQLLVEQEHYADARQRAERALAVHRRLFGDDSFAVMRDTYAIGYAQLEGDELAAAGVTFERARVLGEALLGDGHPSVAQIYQSLGSVASRRGRYSDARRWYERALAVRRRVLPADHPAIAESLGALGDVANASGDSATALADLHEAIAISERRLGPDHPQLAMWLCAQGEAQLALGKLADARASYQRAERITPAASEDHAIPLLGLGEVELAAHRPADALPALERALAIFDREPPTNLNGLATVRFVLAKALWALDRTADARRSAERARADFVRADLGPEDDSLRDVDAWLRSHAR